jgi:hypothetical protein
VKSTYFIANLNAAVFFLSGEPMSLGLDKILEKIKADPTRRVLHNRYLVLVSDLSDTEEKFRRTIDLANIYLTINPAEAMQVANMVYSVDRNNIRSLELIIKCFELLGKMEQANLIRVELQNVRQKATIQQNSDLAFQRSNYSNFEPAALDPDSRASNSSFLRSAADRESDDEDDSASSEAAENNSDDKDESEDDDPANSGRGYSFRESFGSDSKENSSFRPADDKSGEGGEGGEGWIPDGDGESHREDMRFAAELDLIDLNSVSGIHQEGELSDLNYVDLALAAEENEKRAFKQQKMPDVAETYVIPVAAGADPLDFTVAADQEMLDLFSPGRMDGAALGNFSQAEDEDVTAIGLEVASAGLGRGPNVGASPKRQAFNGQPGEPSNEENPYAPKRSLAKNQDQMGYVVPETNVVALEDQDIEVEAVLDSLFVVNEPGRISDQNVFYSDTRAKDGEGNRNQGGGQVGEKNADFGGFQDQLEVPEFRSFEVSQHQPRTNFRQTRDEPEYTRRASLPDMEPESRSIVPLGSHSKQSQELPKNSRQSGESPSVLSSVPLDIDSFWGIIAIELMKVSRTHKIPKRPDQDMIFLETASDDRLVEELLERRGMLATGDVAWEIVQAIWGAAPNKAGYLFLNKMGLKHKSIGFWGIYLDCLVAAGYPRKAKYEIFLALTAKRSLEWAQVAWFRLPGILRALGLKQFVWRKDEGIQPLIDHLSRRAPLTGNELTYSL